MRPVTVWVIVLCLGLSAGRLAAFEPGSGNDPAQQIYLGANGMLNRGLYELAAAEYRRFLTEHPAHDKSSVARYGLAVCLFRMKQYDAAVAELAPLHALSKFTYAAEVGTMLGQSHLAMKRYGEASKAFAVVARQHTSHALADDAAAGWTEALYLADDYAGVENVAKAFIDAWPESALRERVAFFRSLATMARHEYGEAAGRFEGFLERFGEGPFAEQASLLLAQCYQHDNAVENAVRQYRRVLKRAGDRYLPDALLGLATLLQQLDEPGEAGETLDRLLTTYPDSPLADAAFLLRGRTWFDQGEYDDALTSLGKVERDGPLADQASYWIGKCKLRQGDLAGAASLLDAASERFGDSVLLPEMLYDRAIALVRAEKRDAAVKALTAFLQRFPEHAMAAEALQLLAVTEHQRENYDASLAYCETFLQRHPSDKRLESVAFLAAENEFLAGRYERAAERYEGFLAEHGTSDQARKASFRLGMARYRLEQYEAADEALTRVVDGAATEATYRPALLALGDIQFQRSEWKHAASYLSDYVSEGSDAPGVDDALLKLGLSRQRQDKHEAAIEAYDRLIADFEESPHRLQAMFERGQALVSLERLDEAKAAFEAVLAAGEESRFAPYALNHLATIAMQRKAYGETAALFARAAASAPASDLKTDASFHNAEALMAAERFPEADKAFAQFVARFSSHERVHEARAQRAIAIARQDRYEDAVAAIQEAEKAADSLPAALLATLRYEKAWCLRTLGRADEAAHAYDQLLSDGQEGELGVHAMLELAGVHFDAGRFEQAAAILRQLRDKMQSAEDTVPATVREQATYRLGVCEFELKRFREAAAMFEEFVKAFPASSLSASACFFAGEAFFDLGRHDRAVEHLSRVAESYQEDPVYGPALLRLGESLAALQKWSRSEQVFGDYLNRFPDSPQWFQAEFGIGFARENQKRYDDAKKAYAVVVTRHQGPTAARAQFQTGECLFAQKRYEEAVRELLKVDILYAYPQWSAAALFEAGRCFEKLGKTVEARAHFKQVVEGHTDTRWAKMASQHLAELSSAVLPGHD